MFLLLVFPWFIVGSSEVGWSAGVPPDDYLLLQIRTERFCETEKIA